VLCGTQVKLFSPLSFSWTTKTPLLLLLSTNWLLRYKEYFAGGLACELHVNVALSVLQNLVPLDDIENWVDSGLSEKEK